MSWQLAWSKKLPKMKDYKAPNTDWFLKNDLAPPEVTAHGTDDEIREKLKPLKTWGWKLEGNQLSCHTDMGVLCQTIPTDYVLAGEDADGKPLLRKIEL